MTSPKKLTVSLLATCIPVLALAQAEAAKPAETAAPKLSWSVYGTANVNLQTTRQQGTAARLAVSTDSSNVGVRASAELAHGLGATLQCETSANLDGINASGLLCGRNSRVGISSPWGTLFYGTWDTPFKAASYGTKVDDPFGNTDVFGYQGVMGSPGFNYRSGGYVSAAGAAPTADAAFPAGSVVNGFDIRAQNSVGFHSARVEGVSLKAQYSVDEFKSNDGIIAPQLYAAVINFDRGPFSVFASYEYHEDGMGLVGINVPDKVGGTKEKLAFGATVANTADKSSKDQAWRLGAGYELANPAGTTTVSAMYEQIQFEQESAIDGQVKKYSRPAWQVAAKHRLNDHELRARFSQASAGDCTVVNATCSTDQYAAYMIAVGYAYYLAQSTQVYLNYVQIENQRNATYTLTIGGSPNVAGKTSAGSDPRALALGIRYAF